MSSFGKTIGRTLLSNKGRFLANFIICLLSVAISSGLGMLTPFFTDAFAKNYSETTPDLTIKCKSESGFSNEDIDKIKSYSEVKEINPFMSYDSKNGDEYYRCYFLPFSKGSSKLGLPKLKEGEEELFNLAECYSIESSLNRKNLKIGDKISINELSSFGDVEVVGIVESDLYTSVAKERAWLEDESEEEYVSAILYFDLAKFPISLIASDVYVRLNINHDYFSSIYENEVAKIKKKILSDFGEDNISILTMEENTGFKLFSEYSQKVSKLSYIFPIFFVGVCGLINLITISRLMKDERKEIGCYFSLGVSRKKIIFKFCLFSVLSSGLGCLVGYLLGAPFLPYVVRKAYEDVFKLGPLHLTIFSLAGVLIAVGITFASLLITLYISYLYLKEEPADLLKDVSPKPGKKILLERITWLWNKISFSWKSSFRNIFRQKKNLILTLFSTCLSTGLLLLGFGLNDASIALKNDELFANVASSMGSISAVIILFAIAISITVIYSLANMNIEDRKREIATLKVLGYRDFECSMYCFRELVFICMTGAVLSLPFAAGFLAWLFTFLGFGTIGDVRWYSYLASILMVFVSVFIVNSLLYRHIKNIDMNGSLKSVD